MKIHVINPNSTVLMTNNIAYVAREAASAGVEIMESTVLSAPASIEGYADEARAVPGMLTQIMQAEQQGASAHVIACFDDPGLDAAREVVNGPVVGLCESAFIAAGMLAKRFSVVTTLSRSIPIIEDLASRYIAGHGLRRVHAADITVLELETTPKAALNKIATTIQLAVANDRAEAIILGCAGMSAHLQYLSRSAGVPVIDGIAFSVRMAEALVGSGLRTSKAGAYAKPLSKAKLEFQSGASTV